MEQIQRVRLGFAMTGSFCTFGAVLEQLRQLSRQGRWDLYPILSTAAYTMDSRFGRAEQWIETLEQLCGRPVWHEIPQVEPIGPKKSLDLLVVAPCTGNTLAKLANGINDTPVTMAVKSHLRNERPVLLAVSSNDALSAAAKNIGQLLNQRGLYFVPMRQDEPDGKPRSVVADFRRLEPAMEAALRGEQLQPLLLPPATV